MANWNLVLVCFIISFNIPSGPDAFLSWRFKIFFFKFFISYWEIYGFWLSLIVNSSFSNWLILITVCVCWYFIKQCLEITFPYFSILDGQFFMISFFQIVPIIPKLVCVH